MISDIVRTMALGALAAIVISAYLAHLGVPAAVILMAAGGVGALAGYVVGHLRPESDGDGLDYARRRHSR